MSPVGLDVREHGWACFNYTISDALQHEIKVDVNAGASNPTVWLVTRIQAFAAAAVPMVLQGVDPSGAVVIVAGGCLELLPGGAFRDSIIVSGNGGRIIVEYWFPSVTTGNAPAIVVS